MMSPLLIEIGLWYHCRTTDFRDGDFSAPVMPAVMADFVKRGLLIETPDGPRKYAATEGLTLWVDTLCTVPWPAQKWVMLEIEQWPEVEAS